MANSLEIQTLQDGPREVSFKVVGILDTADLTGSVIIDPATLTGMDPARSGSTLANRLAIKKVIHNVQTNTVVKLLWDATTPVVAATYFGVEDACYEKFNLLQNNAGTGVNGKIKLATVSPTAPSGTNIVHFTLVVQCLKQKV